MDQRVRGETPDTLIIVEHPHVVTLGRGTEATPLPNANTGIQVFEIERGGEATYHGPGQLVGYPILLLEHPRRDLHAYLRALEELIINTLENFGIRGHRNPGSTGVWVDEKQPRKIASIGIAVRRWVTYHGFALNISPDLSFFRHISPCGFNPEVMTSIERELSSIVPIDEVKASISRAFEDLFETKLCAVSQNEQIGL